MNANYYYNIIASIYNDIYYSNAIFMKMISGFHIFGLSIVILLVTIKRVVSTLMVNWMTSMVSDQAKVTSGVSFNNDDSYSR